jgi:hypothetical protein
MISDKFIVMRRNFIRLLSVFVLLAIVPVVQAQSCPQFPADCPSDRQLPDSAERFGNPLVPEEVSMELRLHEYFTNQMQGLAENKRWEIYQYDETDGSGHLKSDRSGPLPFNLRPPHEYEISFILIVNKDSLKAWQDWYKDFAEKMEAMAEPMKSGKYVDFSGMQVMKEKKDNEFRNASLVRVKIGVNEESAIATTIQEDARITRELTIPHAVVAYEVHNDKTEERAIFDLDQFKRCTDLAFILFGSWDPKPDSYKRYYPSYNADKKNIDLVTPKKIPSTTVRTIVIHVEGSPKYIDQFLHSLDIENLYSLIGK